MLGRVCQTADVLRTPPAVARLLALLFLPDDDCFRFRLVGPDRFT